MRISPRRRRVPKEMAAPDKVVVPVAVGLARVAEVPVSVSSA